MLRSWRRWAKSSPPPGRRASYAPDLIQMTSSLPWPACGRSTPQPTGKPGRPPCTTLYSPGSKLTRQRPGHELFSPQVHRSPPVYLQATALRSSQSRPADNSQVAHTPGRQEPATLSLPTSNIRQDAGLAMRTRNTWCRSVVLAADRGQQPVEVFSARAACAQVRCDARVPLLGWTACGYQFGVDVQHFRRLRTPHIAWIGLQEAVEC